MFDKDMTIGEALDKHKDAKVVLSGFGLHCFGCPVAMMETLEEASQVHGVELSLILEKLNELDNKTEKKQKNLFKKTKVK